MGVGPLPAAGSAVLRQHKDAGFYGRALANRIEAFSSRACDRQHQKPFKTMLTKFLLAAQPINGITTPCPILHLTIQIDRQALMACRLPSLNGYPERCAETFPMPPPSTYGARKNSASRLHLSSR